MEAYFQYQRVRQSVHQHLSQEKDGASLSDAAALPRDAELESNRGVLGRAIPAEPATTDNVILVGWDGPDDPLNPVNQSTKSKICMTLLVSLIALAVTAASAIDACGVREYSEYFHVSKVVGSLATGMPPPIPLLYPLSPCNEQTNSC